MTVTVSNDDKVDLKAYIELLVSRDMLANKSVELYRDSIHYLGISSVNSSDVDATWRYLLKLFNEGKSKVFILAAISVARGALRLNGTPVKTSKDFEMLKFELKAVKRKPVLEYSEEDIRLFYELTKEEHDYALSNAVLLMALAGLRVGALQGLKYTDFWKHEEVEGVRVFMVKSKGSVYMAAISEWGYQELLKNRFPSQQDVFIYDDGFKCPLTSLLRSRMRTLINKYSLVETMKEKSIFHSFRHFFITACDSTLSPEEVSLLAGHKRSNSMAYKFYVNNDKTRVPLDKQKRIAEAYSRSTLMKFHPGETK